MPPKISSPEPANRVKEREPKDLGLAADYRQWISFEGCCSPATEPTVKRKFPVDLEAEGGLKADLKTLQGGE